MKKVRVRFAPSPTGPLHIGGIRTALFNYLFARKHDGSFVLRIEDTDQKRYVPGAEEYIIEALDWLGLRPDEGPVQGGDYGPYRQSERKNIYRQHVNHLVEREMAYLAFDTPEELEAMRDRLSAAGNPAPKYDYSVREEMKNSLTLSDTEVGEMIREGVPHVVRLMVTPGEEISFEDVIRGEVTFQSEALDDKVLLKADGLPTYHMANIVDDYSMKISHVIRGEEWLSSTAHHVLLYRAMGWRESMPVFAHLPLILKPSGKGKLSKRDGEKLGIPVFPLDWESGEELLRGFKGYGFLNEAVLNFLAFLGWNPGTEQELFALEELIQAFSLDQVQKSGARFDFDKAKWFNQQYMHQADASDLLSLVKAFQPEDIRVDDPYLLQSVQLMQPRLETASTFWEISRYLFERPKQFDETALTKKYKPFNKDHFMAIAQLVQMSIGEAQQLNDSIKGYIQDNELKFGEILPVVRIAIAGTLQGPDLFEMMALLGPDESASRINGLLTFVSQ